jgi:hypothetical protein
VNDLSVDVAHDDVAQQQIASEQAFVDRVYRQLDLSTKQAEALAKEGYGRGRLGHEGGLVERDAMVFQAAKRIATLNAAHEGLVFGRLDLDDSVTQGVRATSAGSACATRTATPCWSTGVRPRRRSSTRRRRRTLRASYGDACSGARVPG